MAHEARTAVLRELFAPLVSTLGYKFTPDRELADFLLEQEAVLEETKGAPYCPCQVRTREREHDMKIVCPCIPYHRAHFDAMRRCWCGLFVRQDVTDPGALPQIAASELGIEE